MKPSELIVQMNKMLSRIGLSQWTIRWIPDPSYPIRGRVVLEERIIEIFDSVESDVWDTFIHEVVEIKMRKALKPYRILVNKLIEGYQQIVDGEKDRFIEELNEIFEASLDSPPSA
jgi:hypothetical protein